MGTAAHEAGGTTGPNLKLAGLQGRQGSDYRMLKEPPPREGIHRTGMHLETKSSKSSPSDN